MMSENKRGSEFRNFGDQDDNDLTLNLDITAIREQITSDNQGHFDFE